MSRIDKALEKAAELKGKTEQSAAQDPLEKALAREGGHVDPPVGKSGSYVIQPHQGVEIDHPLVVTYNDPKSPMAEEFRKLKSYVVNLKRKGEAKKTLMVTSSLGGEGKGVTTINLAITLAQEFDHTVLLVDADLRKPSIHTFFNLSPTIGLADCLLDGIDPATAVIKTGVGKLSFLPAGRAVENPAELLGSERMKKLLLEMRNRYPDRVIILDSPPVLPVAETRILSTLVDGIVFVVKEGAVSLESIEQAIESVSKTKVVRIVYNNILPESLSGHYHYYYHGYHGH